MRSIGITAVFAVGLGLSGVAHAADAPVTFTKDVAPILYKSCVECHRPTMFAPMSLLTYDDARPYARSIKQRVMPPAPSGATISYGPRRTPGARGIGRWSYIVGCGLQPLTNCFLIDSGLSICRKNASI